MCIICVKERGINPPAKDTFEAMWENNPDGAGFMYTNNNSVCIEKGFMTLNAFLSAYNNVAEKIDTKETPMVFHFRITTHGGTIPENCHPFPVTESLGSIRKLKNRTDLGVAHNGVISGVTPRTGISDTMEYVITKLATMKHINSRFAENKWFESLISQDITTDKMAFLSKDGKMSLIGDFVTDEATGIKYSNKSYEESIFSYANDGYYPWGDSYDYGYSYIKVCDVYDLGGAVEYGGNTFDEYGMFYMDKKGKLYAYVSEFDAVVRAKGATLIGNISYDYKYCTSMSVMYGYDIDEIESDYMLLDSGIPMAKCAWCGKRAKKNELESTELGLLCINCLDTLDK